MESTTPATAIAILPTSLNRPISNDIDTDFDYPKRKSPAVLVHYNAEPHDRSNENKLYIGPVSSTTTPPPITTYKPFYAKPTTVLPLTSTLSPISPSTSSPTQYYYNNPAIAAPSKYFVPTSSQGERTKQDFNHTQLNLNEMSYTTVLLSVGSAYVCLAHFPSNTIETHL